MKSLLYALLLTGVLLASIVLLRSVDPPPTGEGGTGASTSGPSDVDRVQWADLTPDESHEVGSRLLALRRYRDATEALARGLAADSTDQDICLELIECYTHPVVSREDYARIVARRAVELAPSKGERQYASALVDLYVQRDYLTAAHALRGARRRTNRPDAAYHEGVAWLLAGQFDPAGAIADSLLAVDDANSRALELAVRVAVATGDYETAESRARALAQLFADEPYPYVLLAQVRLLRGDPDEAVGFCNTALELAPRSIPAIVARANLYAHVHEFEPARLSLEKLLLFDDPTVRAIGYDGIGFVDFLDGRFEDGTRAIDEAIRETMLAGSPRVGLRYANRLVEYLCALGKPEEAKEVVRQWVTGFGDVPVGLQSLRILILDGKFNAAQAVLENMRAEEVWQDWMRALSIDYAEMDALAHITVEAYERALDILTADESVGPARVRRDFLTGYAAFETGQAERAAASFERVRGQFYTTEFPYRGNPVLYVQSLFYLAETRVATGNEAEAAAHYRSFLDFWDDSQWGVAAVDRARLRMERLAPRGSSE